MDVGRRGGDEMCYAPDVVIARRGIASIMCNANNWTISNRSLLFRQHLCVYVFYSNGKRNTLPDSDYPL